MSLAAVTASKEDPGLLVEAGRVVGLETWPLRRDVCSFGESEEDREVSFKDPEATPPNL